MEYAVEILGLEKVYKPGNTRALTNISLTIETSTVFGILGTNGAGKSTLIKILSSLIEQDAGSVKIFGKEIEHTHHSVGYMPEESSVYEFLTGQDFVEMIGLLRGMGATTIDKKIHEMKDILELPDLSNLISSYSKGNKEKILFLSSIIHDPTLLILDEPFTGFDPRVIYKVKKFIADYAAKGNTVILCTHILEMASQLCDQVVILVSGNIKGRYDLSAVDGQSNRFKMLENVYLREVGTHHG